MTEQNTGHPDFTEASEHLYSQPVTALAPAAPHEVAEPCPVCGGLKLVPRYRLPGTRFDISECPDCGLGRLDPPPDQAEIAGFYPAHYYGEQGEKFTGVIERLVRVVGARHARFLARQAPRGGRILDVGCGRGAALRSLADEGLEVHGFEISDAAVVGIDPRIRVRVAPSLVEAGFDPGSFDAVMLWHVLEHVPGPRETLAEAAGLLRPGGVLVVAVPNFSSWQARWTGARWFHLDPPRHLFHFPAAGLRRLMQSLGLRLRSEHHFSLRQNPFGWIQSLMNAILGLPRNGLYVLLQPQGPGARRRWTWGMRIAMVVLGAVLAPIACVMSVVEALARQGATIHIVAERPRTSASPTDAVARRRAATS